MNDCKTCALRDQREAGNAPLWDDIYRTAYWHVVHSYNTALPGWLVLVSRRHMAAIDEMTEAEAAELGLLIRRVSVALREVVGCAKTYVAQFAEAQGHNHVHFHIVPRQPDQPLDRTGPNVFKYLGVPDSERISDDQMNHIGAEIRRRLQALSNG